MALAVPGVAPVVPVVEDLAVWVVGAQRVQVAMVGAAREVGSREAKLAMGMRAVSAVVGVPTTVEVWVGEGVDALAMVGMAVAAWARAAARETLHSTKMRRTTRTSWQWKGLKRW